MLIILDLDETLIHSVTDEEEEKYKLDIARESGMQTFNASGYTVIKRPFLDEFLDKLLNDNYYAVGIWSAGEDEYVNSIVDNIVKNRRKLAFVMARSSCVGAKYTKPLDKAWNIYLKNMYSSINPDELDVPMHPNVILIDDRKDVTGTNNANHLCIDGFEGDPSDTLLKRLLKKLMECKIKATNDEDYNANNIVHECKFQL